MNHGYLDVNQRINYLRSSLLYTEDENRKNKTNVWFNVRLVLRLYKFEFQYHTQLKANEQS
ncbi:CLUMA_CG010275, isoform A [Clunio marinus]|uniref:CLUMA_CG010275, isoform A n=1 Tax=Clunio marinus TaxID=568069 RepID=A0A1J1I9B5_9DIPT|nr:CLUMA_CG010275, isoform A [Clunio marinus]